MRKLILGMFVSLDGFVSGPKGEADWIFRSGDDATDQWVIDNLAQAGLIAMGRVTYDQTAGFWPTSDLPFAAPMNAVPKLVFTRVGLNGSPGTPEGSWENPFVARDLSDVTRLKAQPGKDIRALGGADFGQSLAASGLVDEYHLFVAPVALGQGIPLFSKLAEPLDLELITSKTFATGAIALMYRTKRDANAAAQ